VDGSLPENEVICVDVLERMLFFVLDGLSEGADSFAFRNLYREGVTGLWPSTKQLRSSVPDMVIIGQTNR
jgi:hypothetical protein